MFWIRSGMVWTDDFLSKKKSAVIQQSKRSKRLVQKDFGGALGDLSGDLSAGDFYGRDLSTSWRYVKVRICVARKIKYLNRMWNRGHSFRRSIDHSFTFSYAKHIQTCTVPSELKKYMPHLQETNLKWLYFGCYRIQCGAHAATKCFTSAKRPGFFVSGKLPSFTYQKYCGWKKSCTSW